MVPQTMMTGQPTDISDICEFGWYEWCYFQDAFHPLSQQVELLGRVLGPAKSAGNAMSQWVMNNKGNILPQQMLRKLTLFEESDPTEVQKRSIFASTITKKYGDSLTPPPKPLQQNISELEEPKKEI
mmetsp:Transcript_1845/g.3760  ORF Transcript_1845/g.3760 Transcript_1845/m.3760 type:complete len:127 (-) Transcript_1845:2687-3067(-)